MLWLLLLSVAHAETLYSDTSCLNVNDDDHLAYAMCNVRLPPVHGCMDVDKCGYNQCATHNDSSCSVKPEYQDCEGNCLVSEDCDGVCGGTNIALDNYDCDGNCIVSTDCNGVCGGTAVLDECWVCGGSGIADGKCDCAGNVLDCNGDCGGAAAIDACGVCGGSGYPEGACDCAGTPENETDVLNVCGGFCERDEDSDGVCDHDPRFPLCPSSLRRRARRLYYEYTYEPPDDFGFDYDYDYDTDTDVAVAGCMDPNACNYDESATCDDGSCNVPEGCESCDNYRRTQDHLEYDFDNQVWECTLERSGCTDETACNYDEYATEPNASSCIIPDDNSYCDKWGEVRQHEKCGPGFGFESSTCVQCDGSTYSNETDYSPCIQKTVCSSDQIIVEEGDQTTDRTCGSDAVQTTNALKNQYVHDSCCQSADSESCMALRTAYQSRICR